jgi:hypothetical protein
MRVTVEIDADFVVQLTADLFAKAGSKLVFAEGRLVAVIPPPERARLVTSDKEDGWRKLAPEPVAEPVTEPVSPPEPETAAPEPELEFVADALPIITARTAAARGTQERILTTLQQKGPLTSRALGQLLAPIGGSQEREQVTRMVRRLHELKMIVPTSDARYPAYMLPAKPLLRVEPEPEMTPFTAGAILETLEDARALSLQSIAQQLGVSRGTQAYAKLIGTVGALVKRQQLAKVDVNGIAMFELPGHHQPAAA